MARHRAGDAAGAEQAYRDIDARAPGHPDVAHLLGLALLQQGRLEAAREAVESAIARIDGNPNYHNSLGEVHRAGGDFAAAVECYRAALARDPGHLQAANNLGLALHAGGDPAAAREVFADLAAKAPEAPEVHNNLGVAEQALGHLDAAVACFRTTTGLAPGHAEAWNNLGAALHQCADLDGALEALTRARELAPGVARVHYNLSRTHAARGEHEEAEAAARRATELDPSDPEHHLQLAFVLRAAERYEASMAAVREALARAPDHAVAHNDLGVMLLMQGEFAEAERHLRAALEHAPRLAVAWENLARTRRFGGDDDELMQGMEQLAAREDAPESERMHLEFALAKMWDDRGEPERAFPHLVSANAAVRRRLPWDADARSRHVDRLMEVFGVDWFRERSGFEHGHPSAAPVFIVGMLRSGTTLVEQILASHSKVEACGELDFFDNLARVMPERLGIPETPYPDCARSLSAQDLNAIAASYLSQVLPDPGAAARFTDKNPLNFDHLGLIAVMFPGARLVHVTRDPVDTGLSIYLTHFSREHGFAYDLADIGRFHRDYQRLMEHWRGCLGPRLHEVSYEQLLADQKGVTRALLEHCGLDFEPACLDFHETRRAVSHWQVRQPLYSGARGRAERYGAHLDPLRRALAG